MKWAEIPLTRGLVAKVDPSDFDHLTNDYGSWHAYRVDQNPDGDRYYARTNVRKPGGGYRGLKMHVAILGQTYVDHINGDRLDNRRSNLRPATQAQNARNRGKSRNNTSGFKGVFWNPRRGNWTAAIRHEDRLNYLGAFTTREEAAAAYDAAAIDLHGEFARLNFAESR